MHTPDLKLGERGYEPAHIDQVLASIRKNLPSCWASFAAGAREKFREAVKQWEDEHPDYVDFLDSGSLQEYEDDPNGFKGDLRKKCPIRPVTINLPSLAALW